MNDIGDDIKEALVPLLRRTNDDFGITLSGNPISKEIIEGCWRVAYELHNNRINSQPHDSNTSVHPDPNIGLKRVAF